MENSSETDSVVSNSTQISDARTFYNSSQELGLDRRRESKILHLRNFNNWIKSTLISEYLQRIRNEQPDRHNEIHVFDMGCGKGGDQLKWQIGRVNSVTFADIAENSVEVCKQRYNERKKRSSYEAEFFTLDCTKELIRDKMKTTEPCFDLVSTQFVLHYSFDRLKSANQFLRNAAEFLRVGGYFIGTTINSCDLVERCRNSSDQTISNDVFRVQFDRSIDLSKTSNESIPLFGAKYHFSLDDVVDCPEYLVYFPLLVELAKKHGLEVVDRQTFREYFDLKNLEQEGGFLLKKMNALEYYELPVNNSNDQRKSDIDHTRYSHTANYFNNTNMNRSNRIKSCRTLSKQEWEMTSLYIIFAFKKTRQVDYKNESTTKS